MRHPTGPARTAILLLLATLASISGPVPLSGDPGGPGVAAADTVPTRVTVRVVSHDAKVIGSGVGGARITIREVATGRVLAEGVQEGSTGDTRRLVVEPRRRGQRLYDEEAAGFTARIPLTGPTRVRIAAAGPLGTPHAVQHASKTVLLVPGVDLVGDGVVLELNGFTVSIDAPARGGCGAAAATRAGGHIVVRARVTMLCGCPIEPGGLWDARRIRVLARVVRDGRVVAEQELGYAGEASTFEGTVSAPSAGRAELQVLALDPDRANTGMARAPITLVPGPAGGTRNP